jgi:hypothetical protein
MVGTCLAIHDKHVPGYLAEFEYRVNHGYDLAAMLPAWASASGWPGNPRFWRNVCPR